MSSFRGWESALIGEDVYHAVEIKEVKDNKFSLRFSTQSKNPDIDHYSAKAKQNNGNFDYPYDPNNKKIPSFAIEEMGKYRDDLNDIFKMYKRKSESYKNLSPVLQKALGINNDPYDSSNIEFVRVDASHYVITGDGRETIVFFDIVNREA